MNLHKYKKQVYNKLLQKWCVFLETLRLFLSSLNILGSSPGKSLPSALITLAVGSMLLTPFLSFVSSRSLGSGSAAETFNEQYAADAGVEYGIWSLLNDPAFRSLVDVNAGIPQTLGFPGSINGSSPTISITAIPLGSWYLRQAAPANIKQGGSLAYAGGDRVYALRGNKQKDFGYYSISGDSWHSLAAAPQNVGAGGSLVYGGGNFLYALRGDKQDDFWRYNIITNIWTLRQDTPDKVDKGGSLVYGGGTYLYAFRGNTVDFWRYDISTNTWGDRQNAPEKTGDGADLVYNGGNYIYAFRGAKKTNFWRYSISGNSWSTMHAAPGNVDVGGSLVYYSGNYIYAYQGKSVNFWRYNISSNSWTSLTNAPSNVGEGANLIFTNSEGGFGLRGNNSTDFWEFEVTPPRYDISSQAGNVTTDTRIEIDGSSKSILFWDID